MREINRLGGPGGLDSVAAYPPSGQSTTGTKGDTMKKRGLILATLLLVGCGGEKNESEDSSSLRENVDDAVEAVTGIAAIKAGEKAKDKIKAINEEQNRKLQEALKETQ